MLSKCLKQVFIFEWFSLEEKNNVIDRERDYKGITVDLNDAFLKTSELLTVLCASMKKIWHHKVG